MVKVYDVKRFAILVMKESESAIDVLPHISDIFNAGFVAPIHFKDGKLIIIGFSKFGHIIGEMAMKDVWQKVKAGTFKYNLIETT